MHLQTVIEAAAHKDRVRTADVCGRDHSDLLNFRCSCDSEPGKQFQKEEASPGRLEILIVSYFQLKIFSDVVTMQEVIDQEQAMHDGVIEDINDEEDDEECQDDGDTDEEDEEEEDEDYGEEAEDEDGDFSGESFNEDENEVASQEDPRWQQNVKGQ